ncbi:hypothetical protein EVJ58_g10710 [Rhodofomes roseus]|uniref:Uncharacterized protein n=1 Tax=Rhodofomes roseus TaxID=34475 RepID=A0A4Y9XN34_9APHY|nr:hypothetical protein EVJ58_g10710 [Rhodofomes roseus]
MSSNNAAVPESPKSLKRKAEDELPVRHKKKAKKPTSLKRKAEDDLPVRYQKKAKVVLTPEQQRRKWRKAHPAVRPDMIMSSVPIHVLGRRRRWWVPGVPRLPPLDWVLGRK